MKYTFYLFVCWQVTGLPGDSRYANTSANHHPINGGPVANGDLSGGKYQSVSNDSSIMKEVSDHSIDQGYETLSSTQSPDPAAPMQLVDTSTPHSHPYAMLPITQMEQPPLVDNKDISLGFDTVPSNV